MQDHGLGSFAEVVAHYVAENKHNAEGERRWFRIQPKLHHAVRLAGLATGPRGRRFRHQYRIPKHTLERASRALLRNLRRLGRSELFDELLQRVDAIISPISGIGELTVYDTAVRIGARLGLSPERVYLHAGARHGAHALGFDARRGFLLVGELPAPLDRTTPEEAEDILCIYAGDLARLAKAAV